MRNIDVHEITLGKWMKKARESHDSANAPPEDSERAELERLRAENAGLKMQVEFAKKVACAVRELIAAGRRWPARHHARLKCCLNDRFNGVPGDAEPARGRGGAAAAEHVQGRGALVLRHENAVLRRQLTRPVRYEPADRVWFAALSSLIRRQQWARVFPVTPGPCLPGTVDLSPASGTTADAGPCQADRRPRVR